MTEYPVQNLPTTNLYECARPAGTSFFICTKLRMFNFGSWFNFFLWFWQIFFIYGYLTENVILFWLQLQFLDAYPFV